MTPDRNNKGDLHLMPGGMSAFTTIVIFVVLILGGISLAPLTSFKFLPESSLPSITVRYSWPNISGRVIEMQVTSPLEGAFSTIRGLKGINSESSRGSGRITLSFHKKTDMDEVRFEVSALIRQVYPTLPEGVSRPQLSLNRPDAGERALLTYTINAKATVQSIGRIAEDLISRRLAEIPGIYNVHISGVRNLEWEMNYDPGKLTDLGLTAGSIRNAIINYFSVREPGQAVLSRAAGRENKITLLFRGNTRDILDWEQIPVALSGDKIVRLTEVVKPLYVEQSPNSYYRINGLNTVNMTIMAEQDANQLKVAEEVKEKVQLIRSQLPPGFTMSVAHDSTAFLKAELKKNVFRTSLSLVLLLAFVFLITWRGRYLLIVSISLLSNLIIAFVFYYFLRVEIHLYSLAGITVSLGIIIDNTIVMIDHLRHKKNLTVFIALLAATLTTIGALIVIFFLEESQKVNLVDFAMVVIINLTVCLFISLFFVPALMEKIPIHSIHSRRMMRRKRRVGRFNRLYARYISFAKRKRLIFITAGILAFGIPVFWLPEKIEGEKWYHQLYNSSLGSEKYIKSIKPVSDKVLGGALRLFVYHVSEHSYFTQPERTMLHVRAYLPEGSTIEHANTIMEDFENYLAGFDEVEQYHTWVNDPESGSMTIHFFSEHENSYFPYRLKSLLEQKSIYAGGADFTVYGVGQGFSNRFHESASPGIRLSGYNYEMLTGFASKAATQLEENPRIQKVYMQSSRQAYSLNLRTEYFMDFDKTALARLAYTLPGIHTYLSNLFIHDSGPFGAYNEGEYLPMRLKAANTENLSLWDVKNTLIQTGKGKAFKLNELAEITRLRAPDAIQKQNQQYFITLMYDFIGPHELARIVRESTIKELNSWLPIGFNAEDPNRGGGWRADDKKQYSLILLVIVIIFFICAILLESLLQPLAVILMLILSYIGVFLTFYLFKFNFDQGGYAAFIFLSGIVVNSALYILNDLNNLKKSNPRLNGIRMYIKAYNTKIIPVILTVLSTILGLTPFLFGGKEESFWFALAAGTIGGLVFSMLVLVLFMPVWVGGGGRRQEEGDRRKETGDRSQKSEVRRKNREVGELGRGYRE
jgi:multidrug efflux pump subunit AcrB